MSVNNLDTESDFGPTRDSDAQFNASYIHYVKEAIEDQCIPAVINEESSEKLDIGMQRDHAHSTLIEQSRSFSIYD